MTVPFVSTGHSELSTQFDESQLGTKCVEVEALKMLHHEPRTALASGEDGLDAIRQIAAEAGDVLKPGGKLIIEHGADQAEEIARILVANGWTEIMLVKDLSGLPRVTLSNR